MFALKKPRLPSHYYVMADVSSGGEEHLHFISQRRRIKFKSEKVREFKKQVIPLLDGVHTLEEIQKEVAATFAPEVITESLEAMAAHNLLEDAGKVRIDPQVRARLEPQLNFFHEMGADQDAVREKLATATVTVLGLNPTGAAAAISIASAHVGTLRCVDSLSVSQTDPYFGPIFSPQDVGSLRVERVSKKIKSLALGTRIIESTDCLDSEDSITELIAGSNFVVCCLDPGFSSSIYKLNRACLRTRTPWTSCTVSAFEGTLGPTVHPFQTACYLCYGMRMVACSDSPDDEFSLLRLLEDRRHDDSGKRENVAFGAGIMGNLAGLEAIKALTGFAAPSALGQLIVVDLLRLSTERHLILRKPGCPACFRPLRDAAQ